ncbi:MAG: Fe-S cluster assembly ATPase SufC [Pseudomonadales bacterium]|nr:Fe-S cluster assembly ATPase SufC [Pseudomonadales bacterium]
MLIVENLHVQVEDNLILKGLNLRINAGEVHAIMGPNGSGKSTLSNVLAGKPGYEISDGSIKFLNKEITEFSPEERARMGLFLAFQYPVEIPGVSNMEFLKTACDSISNYHSTDPDSSIDFIKRARRLAEQVALNPDFLKRGVNEGFSGGEKKRNEILQLLMLKPRLAILDETDSGLDIDALKTVSEGINSYRNSDNAVLMITHYQRLLDHIKPDFVHVLANGQIVQSGDHTLAEKLEAEGYGWLSETGT